MSSLDGIANARIAISDAEAATRERIHNPAKICKVCGAGYEYSLRITFGSEGTPDACVHDSMTKVPNADRNEISRMAERAIKAETNPFL